MERERKRKRARAVKKAMMAMRSFLRLDLEELVSNLMSPGLGFGLREKGSENDLEGRVEYLRLLGRNGFMIFWSFGFRKILADGKEGE